MSEEAVCPDGQLKYLSIFPSVKSSLINLLLVLSDGVVRLFGVKQTRARSLHSSPYRTSRTIRPMTTTAKDGDVNHGDKDKDELQ